MTKIGSDIPLNWKFYADSESEIRFSKKNRTSQKTRFLFDRFQIQKNFFSKFSTIELRKNSFEKQILQSKIDQNLDFLTQPTAI